MKTKAQCAKTDKGATKSVLGGEWSDKWTH